MEIRPFLARSTLALFICLLWQQTVRGFELVFIHHISKTQKTFVTRQGKAKNIPLGGEATFSSPYVSVVAKAVTVSREFTQWKLVEPGARVPFSKGQIVTYQGNTEGVWTLDPDRYFYMLAQGERDKLPLYLQNKEELVKDRSFLQSLSVKGFYSKGISESVSLANSAQITSRVGNQVEVMYERKFLYNFYWGVGFRYDKEVTDSPTVLVDATRSFLLGDLSYHFNPLQKSNHTIFYFGVTVGTGNTKTTVAAENLVGKATIMPAVRLGMEYLFNDSFSLQLEGSFESISQTESFSDGDQQNSNFVNLKVGLGTKLYF